MSFLDLVKEIQLTNKTDAELFVDLLDKFIIDSKINNQKEERLAFRPSSYYKCTRQVWYFLNEFPQDLKVNPQSERRLKVGTALHEWIQRNILMELDKNSSDFKLLKKEDMPVYGIEGIEFIDEHGAAETEIKFLDYRFSRIFPISAMVDGAFHFKGKDYIFEFKTIQPSDYKSLKEPLKDHKKQGAIYSLCLGIPNVMFLYLDKGTQRWQAFSFVYSENHYLWVKRRIDIIEHYVEQKILPPKEVSKDCTYCPYKKFCEKDAKEFK
jgi:CRISPR/Cas system-associated exonuclease Cas4 (RecB family)